MPTYSGTTGNDVFLGTTGADVFYLKAGNDTVYARSGDDTVYGASGKDTIDGESGDDLLFGGSGNDKIYGGSGNDEIWGGAGNDALNGEDGADRFYFGANFGADFVDFDATEGDVMVFAVGDNLSLISTGNRLDDGLDGIAFTSDDLYSHISVLSDNGSVTFVMPNRPYELWSFDQDQATWIDFM